MAAHKDDAGCSHMPSEEEIKAEAEKIKLRKLAAKAEEPHAESYREPRVVRIHESGRVIRKAVH